MKQPPCALPETRQFLRVLKLLKRGNAVASPAASSGKTMLTVTGSGPQVFPSSVLEEMKKRDLVARTNGYISATTAGSAFLRRHQAPQDPYQNQHRTIGNAQVEIGGAWHNASVNRSESPLGQLACRKGMDGRSFLEVAEWEAGERLRKDYERGAIMPGVCANWNNSLPRSKRSGASTGHADLSESAMAARARVEKALAAVGPELSGVLVDICCFLKGLERIETERGWPRRSGKVLLKAALSSLSRHYSQGNHRKGETKTALHWGADG